MVERETLFICGGFLLKLRYIVFCMAQKTDFCFFLPFCPAFFQAMTRGNFVDFFFEFYKFFLFVFVWKNRIFLDFSNDSRRYCRILILFWRFFLNSEATLFLCQAFSIEFWFMNFWKILLNCRLVLRFEGVRICWFLSLSFPSDEPKTEVFLRWFGRERKRRLLLEAQLML